MLDRCWIGEDESFSVPIRWTGGKWNCAVIPFDIIATSRYECGRCGVFDNLNRIALWLHGTAPNSVLTMIALNEPKPSDQNLENAVLVVMIDRPSAENPKGFIALSAGPKPLDPDDESGEYERAAEGPLNEETIEAIIRDLRSYIANGKKARANQVGGEDKAGGKSL